MARGVGAEERRDAVTILADGTLPPPDDIDESFDGWRAATAESQVPGKVTVWQIPMDAQGVPQPSAKNQVRLGAWPVDAYDFDGLCALLIRDFMTPEKILCVRMLGTKAGTQGLQFNRVLTLRAPNVTEKTTVNGAAVPESAASLLKVIQENNAAVIAQVQKMLPQSPQRDATEEIMRMMAFAKAMNEPMMTMLGSLLPAIAGRPVPGTVENPFGMVGGLITAFKELSALRGDGGGGGDDGDPDSVGGIIKALVPVVKPALEAIPAILAQRGPAAVARPALAGPPQPRPMAPGAAPTQPAAAQPPQPAGPKLNIGDIPSGDQQMFAQLKPQIDALVTMAAQGSDADGAADILFEQVIMELPDDYYEKLADLIGGPNFVTQAAVFNPAVNSHAEWFKKFQARVIERYNAEDTAATTTPTPIPPPAA